MREAQNQHVIEILAQLRGDLGQFFGRQAEVGFTIRAKTSLGRASVGALECSVWSVTVRLPGGQGNTQDLAHLSKRKLDKVSLPGELKQILRSLLCDRSQVSESRAR